MALPMNRRRFIAALATTAAAGCSTRIERLTLSASPDNVVRDVCVYGTTVAGIAAAIQVAQLGGSTVLLSEDRHVGGMTTGGLSATDIKSPVTVNGWAREFYRSIYRHYAAEAAWTSETRADYIERLGTRVFGGLRDDLEMQWVFEPHVASDVLNAMMAESNIAPVFAGRIETVEMDGSTIRAVTTTTGRRVTARCFIDASYGGDLMAAAGISHIVGRESTTVYGEPLAGRRIGEPLGVEAVGVHDLVAGPIIEGDGDELTQAYCYRMTLTDDPANVVPIDRPDTLDDRDLDLLRRRLPTISSPADVMTFTPMPNHKTDTNGLDLVGASHAWPTATPDQRALIEQRHRDYALGAIWTLTHDPDVPAAVRAEMGRWGLAADEHTDTGGIPSQMYIREARRLIGSDVLTEHHCRGQRQADTPTAFGSYAMDCHVVSHVAVDGELHEEGAFYEGTAGPYPIGYRSLVPQPGECDNLLVPVCFSASHVAYGSARMEPVYMGLGQSAGLAAALAIDRGQPVQRIDVDRLSRLLRPILPAN